MRTIWKFALPVEDEFVVVMPVGAELLHVEEQEGRPHLWALVDDGAPTGERAFQTRGTGHNCSDVGRYVGTYQLRKFGPFVGHVFEVGA